MNANDLSGNAKWTARLYELAESRLYKEGMCDEQIQFLLAEGPNDNDHLTWLILAPVEDIVEWGMEADWGR